MDPIHLQVELDVISIFHMTAFSDEGMASIIFKISLNRPTSWANNDGM
jgi:hypothetical protein